MRNATVVIRRDGTPDLLVPTACCGAKVYAGLFTGTCPLCGQPAGVSATPRTEDHLYRLYGGTKFLTA